MASAGLVRGPINLQAKERPLGVAAERRDSADLHPRKNKLVRFLCAGPQIGMAGRKFTYAADFARSEIARVNESGAP